jgi:hypothetical protein
MRRLMHVVTALLATVLFAGTPLAEAQSFQGGLRGAVKDAQGVIPGVTVTLANEATGVSRDTVTNDSAASALPPNPS